MSNISIGTGSGQLSAINLGSPGDTLVAVPGKYTSAIIQHCKGVTIDLTGCEFNGTIQIDDVDGSTMKGWLSNAFTGDAVLMNGHYNNFKAQNFTLQDVQGLGFNASGKVFYDGTDTSFKFNGVTISDFVSTRSGQLLQGTFGGAAAKESYMYNTTVTRGRFNQTRANGTQIVGVFFKSEVSYIYETYTGQNPVAGDVGFIQFNGQLNMHHIQRHGNRGYIQRNLCNCSLKKDGAGASYLWNVLDTDTTDYGTIDVRIDNTQLNEFTQGADQYCYNITSVNKANAINYWSFIVVIGDYPSPNDVFVKNCLGINCNLNGKTPGVVFNQGTGWVSKPSNNSNNFYSQVNNGSLIDANYYPTSSSLIAQGVVVPTIVDDVFGNPRTTTNDIGAVQSKAVIPNLPPVAKPGGNLTVTLPTSAAVLDGSASSDPDGTISKYLWEQVSGPNSAALTTPNAAVTNVNGLVQGNYVFKLTVTDNKGATNSATVQVTVNAAPVVKRSVKNFVQNGSTIVFNYDDNSSSQLP